MFLENERKGSLSFFLSPSFDRVAPGTMCSQVESKGVRMIFFLWLLHDREETVGLAVRWHDVRAGKDRQEGKRQGKCCYEHPPCPACGDATSVSPGSLSGVVWVTGSHLLLLLTDRSQCSLVPVLPWPGIIPQSESGPAALLESQLAI